MTKPTRKDQEVYERERAALWGGRNREMVDAQDMEPQPQSLQLGWWLVPGYILQAVFWATIGVVLSRLFL